MSDTATRVLVAVAAIPVILLLAYLGGYFWFAFIAAVAIGSLLEFRGMAAARGARVQTGPMIAGSLLLIAVFLHERLASDLAILFSGAIALPVQWQDFIWITLLFGMLVLTRELGRHEGSALLNLGASFLGLFYLGLFLGTAVGIREVFSPVEFPLVRVFGTALPDAAQLSRLDTWGGFTMISILGTIWMCDTAAYFGGRAMGRHKLFERVSPKKTWEGAFWGLAAAIATMLALKFLWLEYLAPVHAVLMGAMVGTIGQVGDLIESLLKRDAQVKDSSALIPGHGGVFDRFDSLIFVSPALFLYLDFIVFA